MIRGSRSTVWAKVGDVNDPFDRIVSRFARAAGPVRRWFCADQRGAAADAARIATTEGPTSRRPHRPVTISRCGQRWRCGWSAAEGVWSLGQRSISAQRGIYKLVERPAGAPDW